MNSSDNSVPVPDGKFGTDAPKIDQLEKLLAGQSDILNMISSGLPVTDVFNEIIYWVEQYGEGDLLASILIMDDTGVSLLHGAAPSLPNAYNQAINGVSIGPSVGSCGTAAHFGELVIVEDIANDPLWIDFRELALTHGLQACWSSPLISRQGKVLGTFAIYYKYPHAPSNADLQLIKLVSRTAVLAIEFHQTEKERLSLLEKERRSIEQGRKEREKFYRLLMDAPAMIAVLRGAEHIFELTNDFYDQAVGQGRKLLGLPVAAALPEVVEPGFINILDNVYHTQEQYIGTEILIKLDRQKNGVLEDRFFNFLYQPMKDENGHSEGIFVHAVDVTDQVVSRKKAEASEERFRSFVLNAPTPIGIYIGREMRIQTANQAILNAWDKDSSIIGRTFREALPELEGQPFYQLLDDVYTTGIPYQATEDRVDLIRNGEKVTTYYNFTYSPLRNENGEIFGVMNTATEVTDLVLAKEKLTETRKNLSNAIEVAELGTWTRDLRNGVVTYSQRLGEWFGLEGDTTTLNKVLALINANDRPLIKAAVEKAIAEKSIYETDYRVSHRVTGEERTLHARGQVLYDNSGQPLSITGTVRDVTPQIVAEKKLERLVELRTAELQKANASLHNVNEELKQFAYIASHDLQEPLRKINVYSNVLNDTERSNLSINGLNYLEKIASAAKRMSALIKDLLEFSRVDAEDRNYVEVDLNEILSNVKVDFEELISQKQAVLTIGKLCKVSGISIQMNQLFYNLIGNALKFTAPDRQPIINVTSRILDKKDLSQFPHLAKQHYCEITVSDNGIGFEEQFAQQIFDIFQRLHSKDAFEGTGIGLALCKKIALNHGGDIAAVSTAGQGASFKVILPFK